MTDPAVLHQAWERGLVHPLLFDSNQQSMWEWYEIASKRGTKIVVNKARQLGGSYWACVIACCAAIANPGWQIKYAAQTQKQVRKILRPHFRAIFATAPLSLRPKWHSQDGEYRFPNGSTITIAGCDRENAETLRGQHAHLAIVDEGGAIANLKYVVDDILFPQTINTDGLLLLISSPAKHPSHPWKEFCDAAEAAGLLLERDIYANPRLTLDQIAKICREAGGPESTTWKREFLHQHVTDEESAVLPEASREQLQAQTIKVDAPGDRAYRPPAFDTYIAVDPGWSPDCTGILWAIWDFPKGRIIVERELVMRKMTTEQLSRELRVGCDELWGAGHVPYMAISDVDHRLIADLHSTGGWNFVPYQKDNLDEALNQLRLSISGQRAPLWTHPRCRVLRRQLLNVRWNRPRTRFERTELDAHYDLVPCAYMLRRHLHLHRNPIKHALPFSPGHGISLLEPQHESKAGALFSKLFKKR